MYYFDNGIIYFAEDTESIEKALTISDSSQSDSNTSETISSEPEIPEVKSDKDNFTTILLFIAVLLVIVLFGMSFMLWKHNTAQKKIKKRLKKVSKPQFSKKDRDTLELIKALGELLEKSD